MDVADRISIPLNWRSTPSPVAQTFLGKFTSEIPSPSDSSLLRTIRATLRGSRGDQDRSVSCQTYSTSEDLAGEEELCWDTHNVMLVVGGVLKKRWNFEAEGQPIQWACIASFEQPNPAHTTPPSMRSGQYADDPHDQLRPIPDPNQRPTFGPFSSVQRDHKSEKDPSIRMRAVFVFLRSLGKVYFMNGLEYTFYLPFIVRRAWPLRPQGIALQRVLDPTELEEAGLSGDPPLPTIFTMVNPIAEASVMGLTTGIIGGFDNVPVSLKDDNHSKMMNSVPAHEHVIWVSPPGLDVTEDVVLTVDAENHLLSVWRYAFVPGKNMLDASARAHARLLAGQRISLSGSPHHSRYSSVGFHQPQSPPPSQRPSNLHRSNDLRDLPDLPPSLSTTTTMASLMRRQGGPPAPVITSPGGQYTLDPDRVFVAPGDSDYSSSDYDDINRMRSAYWMEQLYSEEIDETNVIAWKNITAATFDQRWNGKNDSALLAICLPATKTLKIISLFKQDGQKVVAAHLKDTPALSVASIRATRMGISDLVVLKPNGSLSLFTLGTQEMPVQIVGASLPDGRIKLPGSCLPPEGARVTSLKEGINSQVTLSFEGGVDIRVSIQLMPRDTLTRQCMQMFAMLFPADTFFSFHHQFLLRWSHLGCPDYGDETYQVFCDTVLDTFDIKRSPPIPERNPWLTLGSSSSAKRFQEDPALKRLCLPSIRANPAVSPPINRNEYHAVALHGLHHVALDNVLSVDRHDTLLQLVPLICQLAAVVRPEWADFWKRYYPDAMDEWPGSTREFDSNLDKVALDFIPSAVESNPDSRLSFWPPDIWSMLFNRASSPESNTQYSPSWKHAAQFNISPCFAYGRVDPLANIRHLITVFSALSDGKVTETRKRAENAINLMVQQAHGRSASEVMEHLPIGLVAPLREAARSCQLSPCGDWPYSVFTLIGRNDLAEGITGPSDILHGHGYRSVKENFERFSSRKSVNEYAEEVRQAVSGEVTAVTGVELELPDFIEIRFGQDRRLEEVARMLCSSTIPVIKMPERPELNEHEQAKEQQNQVIRMAERTLALPLGRALFTFGCVPVVTREAYAIPKLEYGIRLQPQNILMAPDPGKIPNECISWGEFHNGVAAGLRISPSSQTVESSWIKFNKPTELTPEHAGFLFALGLTGHLREMVTWHTFSYLTPKHDLTSIAVLLGLSAANVGNCNRHVTKLLAVHTPALLPTPTVDLNVPLITQAAGLAGVGLLYMGTRNRRMAEVCLNQISRKDLVQPDLSNEFRESYTLCAALSFGMIMLGKGTSIPADLALLSRLHVLVHGEGHKTNLSQGRPSFDVNLTSPAATIALGLMYLKTERQDVADMLSIPDTILTLDRIQPNFLLLRTLSRALVMWEAITPTNEWLSAQVPTSIAGAMDTKFKGNPVNESYELAYYNILAGCCFAIALKFAGTAREEAYLLIIRHYDMFSQLAYTNGPAFDHRIKRAAVRDGLNLISISLNMVMAGTGEINCLRRLRYSYGMYNQAIRYGTHVAIHVSLGLLFLGGGRYTLGTSDAAIACMITAFFPRFAQISSDNKTYLQALRHLWVLAVEPRCLIARDVDTKEVVYLPVKIKARDGKDVGTTQLISPTLIPDVDKVLSLRVDTPRYWPFYLDIANFPHHKESLLRSQTLFVKRRTAFLSYMEDPKGSRSLFVRSGSSTGNAATLDFPHLTDMDSYKPSDLHHFISSFSNDMFFLAFADRFCRSDGETEKEQLFHAYCYAALLDSILQDKTPTIQAHLTLYRYRTMSTQSRYFNLSLQDLRFAMDFYSKVYDKRFSGHTENNPRPPLLRETTLAGCLHDIDKRLEVTWEGNTARIFLQRYALGEGIPPQVRDSPEWQASRALSWYLQRHTVPVSTILALLRLLESESQTRSSETPTLQGSDMRLLEEGIKEVLQTSGTQLTSTLGSGWSARSVEDIFAIWRQNKGTGTIAMTRHHYFGQNDVF